MKGLKDKPTARTIIDGFRIYNFIRPHMALDGRTPAEKARVIKSIQQKWLQLIRIASYNKNVKN
jgi:hypothetical protein